MKKLRFFITSLKTGGAEHVLTELLAWLNPEEFDVSLVTILGGDNESKIPDYVKYRCIIKKRGAAAGLLSRALLKLPPRVFARFFLRGEYDYEIAYLEGAPTALMYAKKTNGKKIAFVHCDLSAGNSDSALYKDKQSCLRFYSGFDSVCFVSQDALTGFESSIGKLNNARVIHNVINVPALLEKSLAKADVQYSINGLKLVAVGRLSHEKNYEMLVSVVSELSRQYDLELFIIGEGAQRESLERIIAEECTDCVKLLGFKDNPYPYIRQADLFVCSSLFEGYSTSVTEAAVLNTPVITTECAGMAEILGGGEYGMIVENSRDGMLNGLKKLLDNPPLIDKYRKNLSGYSNKSLIFAEEYISLFE